MRCIICAIAKLENNYLWDWAQYHLGIGFDAIHIYDNNDLNGERVSDVFCGTDINQKIIIHDVRGQKYIQKQVYQQCYDEEEFDWCAFIDIDEYITLIGLNDIHDYLLYFNAWDSIHLNWKCYGDSGLTHYDDRSVTERFTKAWGNNVCYTYLNRAENEHIKSIIRSGLDIDWVKGEDSNPHTPKGVKRVCNSFGEAVMNEPFASICHDRCYIRHYITKTIEEYTIKIERQCADCDAVYYSYPKFFRVNLPTLQKIKWLNSYLSTHTHTRRWKAFWSMSSI